MAQKTWQKPKLVVMLRTKPEENVLTGCKMEANTGKTVEVAGKSTPLCYCYKNGRPAYGVATS